MGHVINNAKYSNTIGQNGVHVTCKKRRFTRIFSGQRDKKSFIDSKAFSEKFLQQPLESKRFVYILCLWCIVWQQIVCFSASVCCSIIIKLARVSQRGYSTHRWVLSRPTPEPRAVIVRTMPLFGTLTYGGTAMEVGDAGDSFILFIISEFPCEPNHDRWSRNIFFKSREVDTMIRVRMIDHLRNKYCFVDGRENKVFSRSALFEGNVSSK
jgi:hypothetical protein